MAERTRTHTQVGTGSGDSSTASAPSHAADATAVAPSTKKAGRRSAPSKSSQAPKTAGGAPAMTPVTVRHYCQGIGDCHLLRFRKDDGSDFWMLIDCGVHSSVTGGAAIIDRVVADIATQTRRLDVVVITHEHTDHISGFASSSDRFASLEVGEVWMAWTESPDDPQARELDKYKQQALAALEMTSQKLDGACNLSDHLDGLRKGMDALLGFNFGAKGERVRALREAAKALSSKSPRYHEPDQPPLTLEGVPTLRIYVLGPSRDSRLLSVTERASEMYGLSAGLDWSIARALVGSFGTANTVCAEPDLTAPFDPNLGTELKTLQAVGAAATGASAEGSIIQFAQAHYFGPASGTARDAETLDQAWRRIDLEWLGVSADLAMQLDNKTNNTSLVLAFEFTGTGRVMIFAADAQVGNWLGWQNTHWSVEEKEVSGPDLMARTVYYKVGHHGSENATLKEKGLGLMKNRDLSAFIPTNAKDAKKVGWAQMPFRPITDALHASCSGRVIRADDEWLARDGAAPPFTVPSGSIRAVRRGALGLWVEVDVA